MIGRYSHGQYPYGGDGNQQEPGPGHSLVLSWFLLKIIKNQIEVVYQTFCAGTMHVVFTRDLLSENTVKSHRSILTVVGL